MILLDVTQHFSGRAADYTAALPDYAAEAMAWLVRHVFHSAVCRVVDIGSGTGKFTRQLLNMGHAVYAVEPNEDMRHTAIRELGEEPRFQTVCGTAEYDAYMDALHALFDRYAASGLPAMGNHTVLYTGTV